MGKPKIVTEKLCNTYLTSYIIAHRIFGWLYVNKLIKEPNNTDEEAAYLVELASFVRENCKKSIHTYHAQFGITGIREAIEFDLKARDDEWELKKEAFETLKMLKSLESILN